MPEKNNLRYDLGEIVDKTILPAPQAVDKNTVSLKRVFEMLDTLDYRVSRLEIRMPTTTSTTTSTTTTTTSTSTS